MPNIHLPADFPTRLRSIRTEHGLAESELASRSGLTYKTIRDLEMGKRRRVMERTIMVLAEALGMTAEELLGDETELLEERPRDRRRLQAVLTGAAITLVTVATFAAAGVWYARDHAHFVREGEVLTAFDPIFDMKMWELETEARISFCEESPWDDHRLLVGLGAKSPEGGKVLCLERATGDTVWTVGPDVDAILRAFGPEIVGAANFSATLPRCGDFNGDGEPELVVRFVHGLYYPCAMVRIDRDGRRVAQYVNKGHVADYDVMDYDEDGLDEVVAWGTNNAPAYQGGTVFILDHDHWRGASIDAECGSVSSEPDSSLLRLVVPQYPDPYMKVMGCNRLGMRGMQSYRSPDGETLFSVDIGDLGGQRILVNLDSELRVLGSVPTDGFAAQIRRDWPDSLVNGTGPSDDVWRAQWLNGRKRFAAGRPLDEAP